MVFDAIIEIGIALSDKLLIDSQESGKAVQTSGILNKAVHDPILCAIDHIRVADGIPTEAKVTRATLRLQLWHFENSWHKAQPGPFILLDACNCDVGVPLASDRKVRRLLPPVAALMYLDFVRGFKHHL